MTESATVVTATVVTATVVTATAVTASGLDWQGERRLFLATPVDAAAQAQLQALQTTLAGQDNALRLVRPDNLHLTLRFLGQADAVKAQALCSALDQFSRQQLLPAFRQQLDSLQYWAGPSIVCLTGELTDPALQLLDERLDQLVLQLGFAARQHPLRPHITLARKAGLQPALQPDSLQYQGRQLVLYHSDSTTDGVRYRPLAQWPLLPSAAVRSDADHHDAAHSNGN